MTPDLSLLYLFAQAELYTKINTVYDAEQKMDGIIDSITNSPIYGMIFYFMSTVGVFIAAVIIVFMLIMLLKKK